MASRGLVCGFALVGFVLSMAGTAAADGNPIDGARVFRQCSACHELVAGKHKVGPSLAGVLDRPAGRAERFTYSPAMTASGVVWTDATLAQYLKTPVAFIQGNRMAFAGLKDDRQIADLIAFLRANGGAAP